MQETWVQFLAWEDPLEKWTSTHSNILAWGILWTDEPGGLQSMGLQRTGHNWATFTSLRHFELQGLDNKTQTNQNSENYEDLKLDV